MLTLPEALSMVGDRGRYQYLLFALFCLNIFYMSSYTMSPTYNFIKPPLLCEGIVTLITNT